MIVKEFMVQLLVPLEAHSRTLWEYRAGDNKLRLRCRDLPKEDMGRAVAILHGSDLGDLPEALGPLYRCYDRADLVAAMPVLHKRGLLPAEGYGPVEVCLPHRNPSFCASSRMMAPLVIPLPAPPCARRGPPGAYADCVRHAVRMRAHFPEALG
ncbi:hypothetical protein D1007_46692 [Hordeum vulgare]|nr:hypothetical protein D1007_46692 [Hordeum vulgare]